MRVTNRSILTLTLLALACAGEEPLTLTPFRAVVYGMVMSTSQASIPNVTVLMRSDPQGRCPAQEDNAVGVTPVQAVTDATGRFRGSVLLLIPLGTPFDTSCIRLDISPPIAFRDTSISVGPVHFAPAVPSDSVRADIVLEPR